MTTETQIRVEMPLPGAADKIQEPTVTDENGKGSCEPFSCLICGLACYGIYKLFKD